MFEKYAYLNYLLIIDNILIFYSDKSLKVFEYKQQNKIKRIG